MAKRKAGGDMAPPPPKTKMDIDGEDSGSDDDASILNVDFEWFDPQPAVDFHGFKTLLRQLFDADNQLFDLSALADLILSQPTLGSTVKCDGNESDPYAFLTVLNLHQHRDVPVIKELTRYLVEKATSIDSLKSLQGLLGSDSNSQVGLILTERFINIPHATVPPMYNMLQEEMQWANDEGELYQFTHYLVISKTYREVASQLDMEVEDDRPQKKAKAKKGGAVVEETFYFHPEDEVLQKHALGFGGFDYTKQSEEGASDSKRAFQEMGVKPQGLMMLIDEKKFEGAVKALGEYLGTGED
ncbi:Mss4p nuclear export [Elasticomyces elasticus]|nr:Mss4p nuclear export [Elasticomyces elasticus]KAK4970733.1 Mss4p nuclear export [Elasticomyces elasticus]